MMTFDDKPTTRGFADIEGQTFSRLTVLSYAGRAGRNGSANWHCRCVCGELRVVNSTKLKSGRIKSCGCHKNELVRARRTTHGKSYTAEFNTYQHILGRCTCPTNHAYADYGGRGIIVCDRRRNGDGVLSGFECFLADMGEKPTPRHSIDRYPDNDGNYEPDNCRWATAKQQANNRRSPRRKCAS